MSSTVKITNLDTYIQIEWPDGTTHKWVPRDGNAWHNLLTKVADAVPVHYSMEPAKGAGDLQCALYAGIAAFCDLHKLEITYGSGVWQCVRYRRLIAEADTFERLIINITEVL